MRGEDKILLHFTASYAIYWDRGGEDLFVLGVVKPKSGKPEHVMLHLLLNTLIYNNSTLLPPIPTI